MNRSNAPAMTDANPLASPGYSQLRTNMVEQQVRPWNVLDDRVLKVMAQVPRENFVPERFRPLAYSDTRIPLGCHQEMIAPAVVGRMLQALEIKPRHRIVEIGTGSGYISACLSVLGHKVTSVEYHEPIFNQAHINLREYPNVELIHGNAMTVDLPAADLVLVTASLASVPNKFLRAAGPEGRVMAVIGSLDQPVMRATMIEMNSGNSFHHEVFDTWLTPIISG